MKQFAKTAAVGLAWFVGYTVVVNLLVRPLVQRAANAANMPKIGQVI